MDRAGPASIKKIEDHLNKNPLYFFYQMYEYVKVIFIIAGQIYGQ